MTWRDQAACLGADPDLFFPSRNDSRPAKTICASCPVVQECSDDGIWDEYGIRGGMTPNERAKLRRELGLKRARRYDSSLRVERSVDELGRLRQADWRSKHGTHACYIGGCRRPECREAHREYQREWRAKTGRSA